MGFMDKFSKGKSKATLPRGARVVRRRRRSGSYDTGYYQNNTFFLLDGSAMDSYNYVGGSDTVLSTDDARDALADCGYDATDYSAPSDPGTSSGGYDSTPSYCDPTPTQSYDSPPSYDPTPSYSPPSYDPSPSYGSSDSGSSYGSSDSGSSYGGGSDSGSSYGGSDSGSSYSSSDY